jgi:TPR repeat protein
MAVDAAAPASPGVPAAVAAAAPDEPPIPSDDRKCSTCDGVRLMERGDYPRAMHIFQLRAAEGDAVAMNNIGWMYENGLGVPPDGRQAAAWYAKAADQGLLSARGMEGRLYLRGVGVPMDYGRAMTLFRTGFAEGDGLSMNEIGFMYQHGIGVAKPDPALAWCWYASAIANGEDSYKHLQELTAAGLTPPTNCVGFERRGQ